MAARRAAEAGVALTLLEADFNEALPFADASFDAVVSRLSVMAAADPVATLRELGRVLEPGGRLVTVLWASPAENPWFAAPREAIGVVLGAERAAFARAFGKLGDLEEAAAAHRAAGLVDVEAVLLHGSRSAPDAASYWAELSAENGHFRRVEAVLSDDERAALRRGARGAVRALPRGRPPHVATHDGARHGPALAPPSAERGDELERRSRRTAGARPGRHLVVPAWVIGITILSCVDDQWDDTRKGEPRPPGATFPSSPRSSVDRAVVS